jgi:pyrroloquinoline quinone biosynthesis protein D
MKGKTASLRHKKIRLASGYTLQQDASGNGHLLMSPKGPIQLNESAALILALCNGMLTAEDIVKRILRTTDDSLGDDVRAFLDAALRRGWIVAG